MLLNNIFCYNKKSHQLKAAFYKLLIVNYLYYLIALKIFESQRFKASVKNWISKSALG